MSYLNKIPSIALALGCAVASSSFVFAAVTTDPVGYKTVTIKGDDRLNLIGLEFLTAPAFTGVVTSVGENTLSFSGVDFDSTLESNVSYFLDVTSEGNEGLNTTVVSWSGNTVTLGDDLSSLLVADVDSVQIHSLPTIGEVFGVGGDVLEGGSSTLADLILMPNPDGSGLNRYYYSSGGFAGVGWRQVGASGDKSNTPIYFSDGLYIYKRSAGDVEITVSGNVKMTSSSVVIEEGFTPFSTIFPSGTTLGNSGLYDAENIANSLSAGSATTADLVLTDSDGDGVIERYYYSSGGFAGAGWRQAGGSGDKADVPLSSGFAIFRRSSEAVSVSRSPAY